MARAIGISGKKQSGKTSLAYYLKAKIILDDSPFIGNQPEIYQDEDGEVFFRFSNEDIVSVKDFDSSLVEVYSFGDVLKECCMYTLGLNYEQCYGTDEQKNTITKYKWDNLPIQVRLKYSNESKNKDEHHVDDSGQFGFTTSHKTKKPRSGYLTAREVMQVVGTDLFREMFHDDIWVDATFNRIKKDKVKVAIIADVRFPSEIDAIKKQSKFNIVRLSKNDESTDNHASETSLDCFKWQDLGDNVLMVDNRSLDMQTKNNLVYDWLFKKKELVNG